MPLPTSVQRAIGEEASEDLAGHLDAQTASHNQHREVLSRMDIMEGGMDGLEGRMDNLEAGQRELREDVRALRSELKEDIRTLQQSVTSLHSDVHKQTRWLVGAITIFGTIISVLLIIGQLA